MSAKYSQNLGILRIWDVGAFKADFPKLLLRLLYWYFGLTSRIHPYILNNRLL